MTMNSFCFMLQMNTVNPAVFFDMIPADDMVKLKQRIDVAVTADDAQKIINDYV